MEIIMSKSPLLLALALAWPTLSAFAANDAASKPQERVGGHGEDPAAFVVEHDLDRNGKVDTAEFERFRRERFAATDSNHDGTLSRDEYVGEFAQRLQHVEGQASERQMKQADVRFNVLDQDKDGKMTWDEYAASGQRLFQRADRNGDGVVDAHDTSAPDPQAKADSAH